MDRSIFHILCSARNRYVYIQYEGQTLQKGFSGSPLRNLELEPSHFTTKTPPVYNG